MLRPVEAGASFDGNQPGLGMHLGAIHWEYWASLGLAILVTGWLAYRALQRTDDPGRLIVKWILTALDFAFIIFVVIPEVRQGGYAAAFGGMPMAAVAGLALAIIWRTQLGDWITRPFDNLFTGGGEMLKPEPQYSVAESLRKKGNYEAALAAVHAQLAQFPEDPAGLLLVAEIQATNLHDLEAARVYLERLVAGAKTTPEMAVFALNRRAEWELHLAKDPEAARATLERLVQAYPESEAAQVAQQRLAHLPTAAALQKPPEEVRIAVPQITARLGLCQDQSQFRAATESTLDAVARLERHLEQFPQDWEAREQLAMHYAEDLDQTDQAVEQYAFLIAQPHQPAKKVVQWLNQLADVHLKHRNDLKQGRAVLQQIMDRYPGSAAAEVAHNRSARLRLELRSKTPAATLKLGAGPTPHRAPEDPTVSP